MINLIIIILISIGCLFLLISSIGIVRLPDIYIRMHATGKAATMGISCLLLAAGAYFGTDELPRMIILIALFFITAPIATTTMARAAHRQSMKSAESSSQFFLKHDDMQYNSARQNELSS
ncbi:MAG: monovalent cation/H(+) antiporter subunit G [Chloroflexota bacterium]